MRDLTDRALNTAQHQGASHADIRVVRRRSEDLSVKNGIVEGLVQDESYGFGVRVIANGAWGFAASSTVTAEEIDRVAAQAVTIAKASARVGKRPVVLAPTQAIQDRYATPIERDPFSVSFDEKIDYLMRANDEARAVPGIAIIQGNLSAWREEKVFASTEGSYIEQTITQSGLGFETTAVDDDEVQVRSYPNSFGHWMAQGWELTREYDLPANARRVAEEAVALLKAPQCPSGVMTLILDGPQTALQIHESCGHPIELDRVLGMEAAFAGTSFLTLDKLNSGYRYGSDVVNMTADATLPGGLGTFGYDDEGVPAQRIDVVTNGIFGGYLTDRQTAALIGMPRSGGCSRAEGWNRLTMIRMTNVNLLPGTWTLDDLIADTDDGLYLLTNRSWSIDDKRLNFQFGCELAYEIKNGKLGRMFKNPTYQGMTPQFWGACDAVCNADHWVVWGTPNCGKGQPMQIGHTGHGAAPARFRNIKVGVMR
ncbi:MAG TPA: TldD/PmbA family protein [Herpetosiphonaceae bacterium]